MSSTIEQMIEAAVARKWSIPAAPDSPTHAARRQAVAPAIIGNALGRAVDGLGRHRPGDLLEALIRDGFLMVNANAPRSPYGVDATVPVALADPPPAGPYIAREPGVNSPVDIRLATEHGHHYLAVGSSAHVAEVKRMVAAANVGHAAVAALRAVIPYAESRLRDLQVTVDTVGTADPIGNAADAERRPCKAAVEEAVRFLAAVLRAEDIP